MTDYAAVIARVLAARISDSRTLSARGTVTAISAEGMVTFTDAAGGTRKGVWVGDRPIVGGTITFLDEGRGIPIVFGTTGTGAPWTTYTPTWTNSGATPSLGNGSLVSGYRRSGTTLHWRGQLRIGSTTTVGSGDVRISLPGGMTFTSAQYQIGTAAWYDTSTPYVAPMISVGGPGFTNLEFASGGGVRFHAEGLAAGDDLQWGGTFELAP